MSNEMEIPPIEFSRCSPAEASLVLALQNKSHIAITPPQAPAPPLGFDKELSITAGPLLVNIHRVHGIPVLDLLLAVALVERLDPLPGKSKKNSIGMRAKCNAE